MKIWSEFDSAANHSVLVRFAERVMDVAGRCVVAALLAACTTAAWAAPAGLFLTDADLQRLRSTYTSSTDAAIRSSYGLQEGIAEGALDDVADPFAMGDISQIKYHWCSADSDGIDNTLYDAQRHIEAQSHIIRSLAFQFALTRDSAWANKALSLMKTWAAKHTPVNIYDFHPNFQSATIDGMTQGFCSDRPWNFALDAMWQTYGLINVSDAYLLMTRNGYTLSPADDALLRAWILRMAQAVNSSFHAWTKWADLHTSSSAYERYRNDNHLSWSMLGLLAAGVALNDANLIAYVIEGGTWDDQRSGPYANPSSIRKVIDGAIESTGRVYEEKINRDPPIGYSLFHLQAMVLIARIDEVLGYNRVWAFKGQDGAGLDTALTRYAPYIVGTPTAGGEGNLTQHAWLYYFSNHWWPDVAAFTQAQAKTPAGQIVKQTAGPVLFMFKGLGSVDQVRPMPPVLTIVDP